MFACRSCQRDQEAAVGRGAEYGQPSGRRQDGAGVHLSAAGRERDGLESYQDRGHARELHQQHRVQLQHGEHHVRPVQCNLSSHHVLLTSNQLYNKSCV